MEISFNYGLRRYLINDNYFYVPLFIFFLILFLKQKRNRQRKKIISPSNVRGGDNSVVLQKLYDQCLKDDLYMQVSNTKVKQIIRRMLGLPANKPIIISASLYLLAILKTRHAPLILQKGGTRLIISNFQGFMSKGIGTILFAKLLALQSGAMLIGSIPLILTMLIYSNLHVDCKSFVDTLPTTHGNLQYIEITNDDAPIIVAPSIGETKTLYQEFDETKVSSITSLSCYVRDNCLGPESIRRESNFKTTRLIPLSERTKTLKDLKSDIDEVDIIDVNNVNYKQEN